MSHHDDAIDVATEDVKWHDAVLAVNDCLRARVEQLEAQLEAYKTPPMHQAIVPILGKLVEGYATIEDMHTVCRVINGLEAEIERLGRLIADVYAMCEIGGPVEKIRNHLAGEFDNG